MSQQIKVGFCVAYDWALLEHALPPLYDVADVICLSIDQDRRSWSGKHFLFDESAFRDFLLNIDQKKKIVIYEDNFYLPELTAPQNEVRQRNLMAHKMGKGGWHIQLDCDEYFMNFGAFVNYLHALPFDSKDFNVCCPLVTLIKNVDSGFLYVNPVHVRELEFIQIATTNPKYEYGRRNGFFNKLTNFLIIHQSWARGEAEIKEKLSNWGHVNDFDSEKYFNFWKSLDKDNFISVTDFHPTRPHVWPALKFRAANTIEEFTKTFRENDFVHYSPVQLWLKNSRTIARLRKMISIFITTKR